MKPSCSIHVRSIQLTAMFFMLAIFGLPFNNYGQEKAVNFPNEYEEFFVYLSIENLGYYEIDAIYADEQLYLPCLSLFRKLSIYAQSSSGLDTISGYLADRTKTFYLNFTSNEAKFNDRELMLNPRDYLISYGDVFLSANVYEALFGFSMNLDFRSLMVRLQSDTELPVVKILKQQKLRENLKSLRGETKLDSIIQRDFHLFRGSVIDWNFRLAQSSQAPPSFQFRGSFGSEIAGGEFVLRTAITNESKPDWRNQSFRWRYVNDSLSFLRQVNLGYIGVPLNSQVTTPLIGAGLSNTPAGFRANYGSMMLQRTIQPGWEVEVFVNNVLVAHTTADANGDFQVEIPLMYGSTEIQIRYYGPWGEEEIEEQSFVIPFLFVPKGKMEYQVFSGVTADSLSHTFLYARVAYGLNRKITLFAGHEYFSRNIESRTMPFASASFVLSDGLFMNYLIVNNGYQKTSLNWRSQKGFFLEGRGKWYSKNQDAELNNNLREYTASFNVPFSLGKTRWLTRGQLRHLELPKTVNQFAEGTISSFYRRFNGGLTLGGNVSGNRQLYSAANVSFQLPKQWLLQAGAQYTTNDKALSNLRLIIQKRFKRRIVVNLSANGLQSFSNASVSLNVFFDLGWMGFSGETTFADNTWKGSQNINGSTLLCPTPKKIQTNTRSSLGRGAIDAMVFLDINHNNQRDDAEPLLRGISVAINRGVRTLIDNDSVYRFVALEPYTRHLLTVSETGLSQISWRLPYAVIGVYADPNSVKQVYIPVRPMGEIEGQVMRSANQISTAAARIPVMISDTSGNLITRISTDASGFFNYSDLKPGNYIVALDSEAMKRAGYSFSAEQIITVRAMAEGDFIQGLDFVITSNQK